MSPHSSARASSRALLATGAVLLSFGLQGCSGSKPSAHTGSARPTGTGSTPPTTDSPASQPPAEASAPLTDAGVSAARIGSVGPCALLTQAEVDTAVGQPLGPGKATIPNYDCGWSTPDFLASVSVTVSGWAEMKTAATRTGRSTAVAGVGDEALTKGGGLLYVRKGTAGFLLLVGGPKIDSSPDHGLAAEKVLATDVLGRL